MTNNFMLKIEPTGYNFVEFYQLGAQHRAVHTCTSLLLLIPAVYILVVSNLTAAN